VDGAVDVGQQAHVAAVQQVDLSHFIVGVFGVRARPVARVVTEANDELSLRFPSAVFARCPHLHTSFPTKPRASRFARMSSKNAVHKSARIAAVNRSAENSA